MPSPTPIFFSIHFLTGKYDAKRPCDTSDSLRDDAVDPEGLHTHPLSYKRRRWIGKYLLSILLTEVMGNQTEKTKKQKKQTQQDGKKSFCSAFSFYLDSFLLMLLCSVLLRYTVCCASAMTIITTTRWRPGKGGDANVPFRIMMDSCARTERNDDAV